MEITIQRLDPRALQTATTAGTVIVVSTGTPIVGSRILK